MNETAVRAETESESKKQPGRRRRRREKRRCSETLRHFRPSVVFCSRFLNSVEVLVEVTLVLMMWVSFVSNRRQSSTGDVILLLFCYFTAERKILLILTEVMMMMMSCGLEIRMSGLN